VNRLSDDPRYKDVAVFTLDYDSGKDVLREWKVGQRATLLAFKGKTEKLRTVNDTDPEAIRKIFEASR
jgi:thioredoxin 1